MTGKKRKGIPKEIRERVWIRCQGRSFSGKCTCCHGKIDVYQWECGHVVSVKNGGSDQVKNLTTLCSACNRSMSDTNFWEYKDRYHPDSRCTIL